MKNRCSKYSKISEAKIREIVRYFAVDLTAMQAAELSGLNRSPVHINGMEGFWGLCKVRLTKFKGLPAHTFHLHPKE